MENVQLKDEDKPMEEKNWESSDKRNFCDESSNTSQQTVDNIVPVSQITIFSLGGGIPHTNTLIKTNKNQMKKV